jgi:hypothetical protein
MTRTKCSDDDDLDSVEGQLGERRNNMIRIRTLEWGLVTSLGIFLAGARSVLMDRVWD